MQGETPAAYAPLLESVFGAAPMRIPAGANAEELAASLA